MNLLMERSKDKDLPAVHAFNTFFFTKLKTAGYQAVKRWTKKVDIFSVDLLLVPIHLGVHWCLAVSASIGKKKSSIWDLRPKFHLVLGDNDRKNLVFWPKSGLKGKYKGWSSFLWGFSS